MKISLKNINWGAVFGSVTCALLIGLFGWVVYDGYQEAVQKSNQRKICFAMECPKGSHPYYIGSEMECVCILRTNKE